MIDKKDKCPFPGCGRSAKFIKFLREDVLMPVSLAESDLQREPPFGVVGRSFLVMCSIHGERIVQEEGHHISTIPKRRKKDKKQ